MKYKLSQEEWDKLKMNMYYCKNFNIPEDFLKEYFQKMEEIIQDIKSNPYIEYPTKENEKKLKYDLYLLSGMFSLYNSNMKKYYNYMNDKFDLWYTEEELDYPFIYITIPCSHNFNKYLSWGEYFSPVLFEKYYMLQVEAIEEFVKSKGEVLPKYLYNLIEGVNFFLVEKLEYFDWKDIPHEKGANLNLPNYHKISGPGGTLKNHEDLYRKYSPREKDFEERFGRFLEREWPIRQWISENRPLVADTAIKKDDCVQSKMKEEGLEKE